MKLPRLVIAGTHSGVGKTTIATGIIAALAGRGLAVQGFKVGPDYIDPGYHRLAAGRISRNLDCWLMGEDKVRSSFCRAAAGTDISIIEGVMGLFDGAFPVGKGSTADVARLLEAPVVLVVDVHSMAQSVAAVVNGYKHHWPQLNVAAVICNRVGGDRHRQAVQAAVEQQCGLPVVGTLCRHSELSTPERHLGLLPIAENPQAAKTVAALGRKLEQAVDLDALLAAADSAPPLEPEPPLAGTGKKVRIALAHDGAFNFYYQDSLDTLTACGAELVAFSPLHDRKLPPDCSGVIIGGGFPETHLNALAANKTMFDSLKSAAAAGMPVYAECGGFMYLTETVTDQNGRRFAMAGVVPGHSVMMDKLAGLGYVTAVAEHDNVLCRAGEQLKGHEFHHSVYRPGGSGSSAFKFYGGRGEDGRSDGYAAGNILASYLHLNFLGRPPHARRFVEYCINYRRRRHNG